MDDNARKALIELVLVRDIFIFHDCDDKETRENGIRKNFFNFCSTYNIDEAEAIEVFEKVLQNKSNMGKQYKYFSNIREILYPGKNNNAPNFPSDVDGRE